MTQRADNRAPGFELTPDELDRYQRHIQLECFGLDGQKRLRQARVLIVGLGGLGSPAAMYLASAGIGSLALVDFDRVERSNLQRQIVHRSASIGQNKVDSARETLRELNPHVDVHCIPWAMDGEDLLAEVRRADVVLDASDNFETRFALNAVCVAEKRPLVSGAAVRTHGQINVFDPRRADSPCYRCVFDDVGEAEEPCALVGVFAPLLGIIGSVQAAETVKLIVGMGDSLVGNLILIDSLSMRWRNLRVRRDPHCPVCGPKHD
ncbi:MAG: molybdopterin-synthase adenylyltransferase MoeB [Pseudomonadota bacterium]